ncbi:MAG: Beta-ketoadipyl-CoA thiolase [Desulfovibrio sp.]
MKAAYICSYVRTPVGRYGGALSSVRADDLGAFAMKTLLEKQPNLDPAAIDDVIMGCVNQAGEDNRNVARMALLLAGLPETVPGTTTNRLCGSGMQALAQAARMIGCGEGSLVLAGGVESMSRAPFVMPKAAGAFSRQAALEDTTIGWRFINPTMREMYGVESMPETAENIADDFGISREDQDRFALRSQEKAAAAIKRGFFAEEIQPVPVPQKKGEPVLVDTDEHPRATTIETLAALRSVTRPGGTITAGNASGVNDGAAALLLADEDAVKRFGLTPLVRIAGTASAGVAPRIMGMGPVPATRKLLARLGLSLDAMDVIELNEAFAAQALGVMRELGVSDDDPRVNPNGGAIALGHPLGMSGARIVLTAAHHLLATQKRYALCTMCIGVGQGIAMVIERA